LLNKQWDGRLEMVTDAVLHCATIAGLGWLMSRWLAKRYWILLWLPLALVLVLPFGWENSLAGFQSIFYFFLLLSLLTLWLLGTRPPGSAGWCCGATAAVLSLFTLASGFLAAAAVFGLVVLRVWRRPQCWKQHMPTLAICVSVILAGLLLKADVRHHHVFLAHSVGDFLAALGANLAWPWIVVPPFALLNLLPLGVLAWRYLWTSREDRPAQDLTLAIGLWTLLQAAAIAYARGADGKPPGWRYMDSTSFILIADCFSIALLLNDYPRPAGQSRLARSARHILLSGFILWGLASAAGLALLNLRAWQIDIPESQFYHRAQLQTARAFMATDDISILDRTPKPEIALYEGDPLAPQPLHQGQKLADMLHNPVVRSILPACARFPLEVRPDPDATHGFTPRGFRLARREPPTEVSWGSYSTQDPGATLTFESLPVPKSRLPYLEVSVAGDLGKHGLSLEFIDLVTHKRTLVKPMKTPGEKWLQCYVTAPAHEFKIVARDASQTGWFAFKAPCEVGRFSFWAVQILRIWSYFLCAGIVLFLLTLRLE
jgi:hypothetical protein